MMRKELDLLEKELREKRIWGKLKAFYPFDDYPITKIIFNLKDMPRMRRVEKVRKIFDI